MLKIDKLQKKKNIRNDRFWRRIKYLVLLYSSSSIKPDDMYRLIIYAYVTNTFVSVHNEVINSLMPIAGPTNICVAPIYIKYVRENTLEIMLC